jgi:hypothetical protein
VFQTIEKLENMVDGGNYYEAQQMYKSTSARYCLYDNLFFLEYAGELCITLFLCFSLF